MSLAWRSLLLTAELDYGLAACPLSCRSLALEMEPGQRGLPSAIPYAYTCLQLPALLSHSSQLTGQVLTLRLKSRGVCFSDRLARNGPAMGETYTRTYVQVGTINR